jgi:hypothetical protein
VTITASRCSLETTIVFVAGPVEPANDLDEVGFEGGAGRAHRALRDR